MSIIAINGKISSGKDTVGEIIQKLCLTNGGPEFEIKKFAGKLKTIASMLTGVPVEKFEDQEFKKLEMPECWNRLQQSGRNKVWMPMTYRQFLQELGTEALRNGLHTNVWVNALFCDYNSIDKLIRITEEGLEEWEEGNHPNWIITDMRFSNEMEAVLEKGGITIRVIRPDINSLENLIKAHPSETALDNYVMHYTIINNGTIEDLVEKVREILIKEKII